VFVFYVPRGGTGQPVEQAEHGQGCWAGLPGLQEDHEEGKRFISQGWWPLIGLEKNTEKVKKIIPNSINSKLSQLLDRRKRKERKEKKIERSFIFSTTVHT
jgi:hypothetical protein